MGEIFTVIPAFHRTMGLSLSGTIVVRVMPHFDRAKLDSWIRTSVLTRRHGLRESLKVFIAFRSELGNPSFWEPWRDGHG
jgi:hypothetical protein